MWCRCCFEPSSFGLWFWRRLCLVVRLCWTTASCTDDGLKTNPFRSLLYVCAAGSCCCVLSSSLVAVCDGWLHDSLGLCGTDMLMVRLMAGCFELIWTDLERYERKLSALLGFELRVLLKLWLVRPWMDGVCRCGCWVLDRLFVCLWCWIVKMGFEHWFWFMISGFKNCLSADCEWLEISVVWFLFAGFWSWMILA